MRGRDASREHHAGIMAVRDHHRGGGIHERPDLSARRHFHFGDDLLGGVLDPVRHVDRRLGDEIHGAERESVERDGRAMLRER